MSSLSQTSMTPVYNSVERPVNEEGGYVSSGDDEEGLAPADDRGHGEQGGVIGMTFNTITNVIGGGVLNLPSALYQASIVVGCILCVFSSICSTFAVYALVKACDYYDRYSMMDIWAFSLFPPTPHEDIIAAVDKKKDLLRRGIDEDEEIDAFLLKEEHNSLWRERMVTLMIVLIFCYNFGCLVLYGVVIGDSLPPVVRNFFHGDGLWVAKGTWLIAGGVVFFVLSCAKKMSELKWSSALGFATILYVIILVVVRYFTLKANPSEMPEFDEGTDDVIVAKIDVGFANAMTTLGLAYCYHYNVPYFYKELHDRSAQKMMKTAVYSQPVTFVSYVATGVFGYLTFGAAVNNAHSGGNIVENYADDDTAVNVGRFGLFFHFCCVYPILAVSCRRGLHHMLELYVLGPWRRNRKHSEIRAQINRQGQQRNSPRSSRGSGGRASMRAPSLKIRFLETPVLNEDPGRLQIAAEAFVIVAGSIVCAWVAPGIKIVVNVTGSLFGLFLMFVAPGIIGVKMFGKTRHDLSGAYNCTVETRKYWSSWVLIVVGVIMIGASFYTIVT